jgi:hypothetical protein
MSTKATLAWVCGAAVATVLVGVSMQPASKPQALKDRAAEQIALLKMKEPIHTASEAAMLASVWETINDNEGVNK